MNYRHAFHAGGFSDVVKHLILSRLVEYLKLKPAAFRVIDTHAGAGRYDLTSREAQRSPEWVEGVKRLIDKGLPPRAQELAAPYLSAIGSELRSYPGSPVLVRTLLRRQDRLEAVELHPEDATVLKETFAGDIQTRVIALDGWLALGAHVPPKEKRGLVLVDPPFEEDGEWARLVEGLQKAHKRWPGGTYALWYPLKEPREVSAFAAALKRAGLPKILRAEVTIRKPSAPPRLYGSGMIVVNPPFVLEDELRVLLPALATVLSDNGQGTHRIEWLSRE